MIISAWRVVTTKNVVRAVLYLVVVLAGAGAQYLLLAQEFIFVVQVIVYIGAIVVLFLFGTMLTRAPIGRDVDLDNDQKWLAALTALFLVGVYGVLARRNAVLVLASIELMLNAVNINLVAFGAYRHSIAGQVFALFVITIAAAEVGVGLAIVVLIFRNRASIALDDADLMKG